MYNSFITVIKLLYLEEIVLNVNPNKGIINKLIMFYNIFHSYHLYHFSQCYCQIISYVNLLTPTRNIIIG